MPFRRVWAIIDHYPGHFWPGEAEEMFNHLIKLDEEAVVVELGCFHGRSSTVIGEASLISGFRFFCVDNFSIDGESAESNFKKYVLDRYDKCTLIRNTITNTAKWWNRKIDYLFIDGDHQRDSITQDCQNWLGFVKDGGVVQFHDYVNEVTFPWMPEIIDSYTEGWKTMSHKDLSCFKRKP